MKHEPRKVDRQPIKVRERIALRLEWLVRQAEDRNDEIEDCRAALAAIDARQTTASARMSPQADPDAVGNT